MNNLFNGCASLSTLDLTLLDTTNVYDFSGIFNGCSSLTDLKIKFNTNNADTMEKMFANCISLKSLDITTFDTQNCNNFEDIFLNDENLELYYKSNLCPNLIIPDYVHPHDMKDN